MNILFVAGLAFVIGLERMFRFFFQKHKLKATSFFLGGVFVVLIGWPIIGVLLEIYGFFLLFRGFFPVVVGFIRRIPVLGSVLNLPFISSVSIDHYCSSLCSCAILPKLVLRIPSSCAAERDLSLSSSLSHSRIIWGWVAEVAASEGRPRLPSPHPLLPALLGESQGVPRPAERHSPSSVFWVFLGASSHINYMDKVTESNTMV
ncbi:hypothetical protein CCH79_00019952, partial [Gambusia affinis]